MKTVVRGSAPLGYCFPASRPPKPTALGSALCRLPPPERASGNKFIIRRAGSASEIPALPAGRRVGRACLFGRQGRMSESKR